MNKLIFKILFSITFFKNVFSSFCGKSGVPYSLEILPNGAPVLGCAQPSCVISILDENGEFQEDSQFLTDANGQSDGFFREGDRAVKRYRFPSGPKINCSGQFNELSCPRRNQWVGGIEYIDHPRQPLVLQCCTFEGLRFSQEVGSTSIGPGEAITGGEVVRSGRQISFDVIANVRKIVKHAEGPEGSKISYEVTVRRMNCLPDPPETEVEFDLDVVGEVSKVLAGASNKEVTDKLMEGKRQQINPKFQKQKIEKFPEIAGGNSERGAPNNVHPRIMPPSTRNLQQYINPNSNNNIEGEINTQQQNLQQQQQFVEQPGFQQQQQFSPQQPSQFIPEIQRGEQVFQLQDIQGQQQIQQQQQHLHQQQFPQQQSSSGGGGSFPQISNEQATQIVASTPHPLFELMSLPTHTFPTLPPHTFPPMLEHSFPTLPTHSFPTLPTHSFPTLPTHTFPTHSFPTLPTHTFPPHTFPTFPPMFGVTTTIAPSIGDLSGRAVAFAAPAVSASSSVGRTTFGQKQSDNSQPHYNPHSPMRPDKSGLPTGHHSPPKMAPAMGTVLAAMQGDRYPIMHPVLGLIGYSNAPQPGQQMG